MRVDSSSTISIAGLSLILVLSSAGRGSAAPELIVNEPAFACHHHGKQLMLSCPMPRQAYHKEGMEQGDFSAISHSCLLQRSYKRGGMGWRSTQPIKAAWHKERRRRSCRRSHLGKIGARSAEQ